MDDEFLRLVGPIKCSPAEKEFMFYEYMHRTKEMVGMDSPTKQEYMKTMLSLPKLDCKKKKKKTKKTTTTTTTGADGGGATTKSTATAAAGSTGKSLFKCRICRSTDIVWTQKQTRSADEAMTVFLECQNCWNKWKQ